MSSIPRTFRAYVADRGEGRLVERELQGCPRNGRRRQDRPNQPADPGHRSCRGGRGVRRSGLSGWRRSARSRLRPRRRPARRLRRIHPPAGELRRCPAGGAGWSRGDGHRDRRVHGGDVRRRARAPRPAHRRRAGRRDGRERRGRQCGRGDPRCARPRGLGGDRQARRGGAVARPGGGRARSAR